jgi:hypothetical protein
MSRTRYARTLAEAFPQDHAEAITAYRRPRFQGLLSACMAIAIGVSIAVLAWAELTGRI